MAATGLGANLFTRQALDAARQSFKEVSVSLFNGSHLSKSKDKDKLHIAMHQLSRRANALGGPSTGVKVFI